MSLSYAGRNIKWNSAEDAQELVRDITKTKELKCLKLEGNTLGVEAAKAIGDALALHPELERAHWKDLFTGRLKNEIPQALIHLFSGIRRANASLIELDLSDNALGPIGVEGIVDFIRSPSCYSLQELRLNNNGLGIKGGTMLAEAMMELYEHSKKTESPLKLKVFICGRNRLENSGAKIFSKFFSMVQSLEEIVMPQNGIFHEGIAALATSFSLNPSLRIISLNDNTFTVKGAKAVARELPKMPNLEVIDFSDCLLKTEGAVTISNALKDDHEKLRELYLESNEIGSKGGLAVVDALRNKPNISHLMLDGNQFGDDGLEKVLNLLSEMGREDILGSMESNEDEEEEEEEEDEQEDGDDSHEVIAVPEQEKEKNEGQSVISSCSLNEFLSAPADSKKLLGLSDEAKVLTEIKEIVKRESFSELSCEIQECVRIFMMIASLSTSPDLKVINKVNTLSRAVLREAFVIAQASNSTSIATNSLLVHLGLLKSENKKFCISWDLRGALICLTNRIQDDYFPKEVRNVLQFFLSRPNLSIDKYSQEKHKLLTALFN